MEFVIGSLIALIIIGTLYVVYRIRPVLVTKIPLISSTIAVLRDPGISPYWKGIGLGVSLLYILFPMDFIPDFLSVFLGIGHIDDLVAIWLIFQGVKHFSNTLLNKS